MPMTERAMLTGRVAGPDNPMWPIPTVARLAWAAIWLVFLGYPIADILGTGYSADKGRHRVGLSGGVRGDVPLRDVDLPHAGPARGDRC